MERDDLARPSLLMGTAGFNRDCFAQFDGNLHRRTVDPIPEPANAKGIGVRIERLVAAGVHDESPEKCAVA
jgi:hypothetical protein